MITLSVDSEFSYTFELHAYDQTGNTTDTVLLTWDQQKQGIVEAWQIWDATPGTYYLRLPWRTFTTGECTVERTEPNMFFLTSDVDINTQVGVDDEIWMKVNDGEWNKEVVFGAPIRVDITSQLVIGNNALAFKAVDTSYPSFGTTALFLLKTKIKVDIAPFDRVAPGNTKKVLVTTDPSPLPAGYTVVLSCDSDPNTVGSATVSPGTINQTTEVTITGADQSWGSGNNAAPNNIKLNARVRGALYDTEDFTVCAHPTNLRIDGIYNNNNAMKYGMAVVVRWDSDGGSDGSATLLDRIHLKEVVTETKHDNPPWGTFTLTTTGWINGDQNYSGLGVGTSVDQHTTDNSTLLNPPTITGEVNLHQDHIFYCERCGMSAISAQSISGAQFDIQGNCYQNVKTEYVVKTTKTGNGGPVSSVVEPGQAPLPPSNVSITMTVVGGDQKFDIAWTDNSDIESGFMRWRWSHSAQDWVRRTPDLSANATSDSQVFEGQPYPSGSVYKYRLRAYNWRENANDVEGTYTVP